LLEVAGDAFADTAGGSSGALYGTLCWTLGERLRSGAALPDALAAALDSAMDLGGSGPGDKTFIDTLAPFVAALSEGWADIEGRAAALRTALARAERGAAATAAMQPRRGRSAALGDRSVGTVDPGAMSMLHAIEVCVALALDALATG
jgi:dihydroxyacetone kinase